MLLEKFKTAKQPEIQALRQLEYINMLPLPALDGGQLVILGIEGLMGRSLARGLKEKLGAVSMALLLLLAVYVTMNDIGRLGG